MQRLRVRFSRGKELKFISHLDISRFWQRALLRADVPLAYSQGFNPHPQIAIAAPLPVGVTSDAELMDIMCYRNISPSNFFSIMKKEMPEGIEILDVWQVPVPIPSLQSELTSAEYVVAVETEKTKEEVVTAISDLLARKEIPWSHERDTGVRHYDLRALIDRVWLEDYSDGLATIGMKLIAGSSGAGRPEQVSLALGFNARPRLIHRTKLVLKSDVMGEKNLNPSLRAPMQSGRGNLGQMSDK